MYYTKFFLGQKVSLSHHSCRLFILHQPNVGLLCDLVTLHSYRNQLEPGKNLLHSLLRSHGCNDVFLCPNSFTSPSASWRR